MLTEHDPLGQTIMDFKLPLWHDRRVRQLPIEAKAVLLYLYTNPHIHYSGLYYLPAPIPQHEIGLSAADWQSALGHLANNDLAYYDPAAELIWVPDMLPPKMRHNIPILTNLGKHVLSLPNSHLVSQFIDFYSLNSNGGGPPEAPPRPPPGPPQGASDPLEAPPAYSPSSYFNINTRDKSKLEGEPSSLSKSKPNKFNKNNKGANKPLSPKLAQAVLEAYNELVPATLPRAHRLTQRRVRHLIPALREYPDLLWWRQLFTDLPLSPWHCNKQNWSGCNFDWIIKNCTPLREKLDLAKAQIGHRFNNGTRKPKNPDDYLHPNPNCEFCKQTPGFRQVEIDGKIRTRPCECWKPKNASS